MQRMILMILAGFLAAAAQKPDAGEVQLKAAIHKEEVDGDLKSAIEQYKKLAGRGGNRNVAAQALFRLGQCYEKQGDAEARKAYERLVREFGDQTEMAGAARARLSALGAASTGGGMMARQAWPDSWDVMGPPSSDGRFLPYIDWDREANVMAVDLVTKQTRTITKGDWKTTGNYADAMALSADGKQIAFAYCHKDHSCELRLADVNGGVPRTLYKAPEATFFLRLEWSGDGQRILAYGVDGRRASLLLIPVDGSTPAVIKQGDRNDTQFASLSPDSKWVALDEVQDKFAYQHDIRIVAAAGGAVVAVLRHAADDLYPMWSPDGSMLLFLSDRTGSFGLWGVPVSNGVPTGSAQLLKPDIGGIMPLGLSRNGSLYYNVHATLTDAYTVAINPATGAAMGEAKPVSGNNVGAQWRPTWSPDGTKLLYEIHRFNSAGRYPVLIQSPDNSQGMVVQPRLIGYGSPQWSPDGQSLLAWGADGNGKSGIFRIQPGTGEATLLISPDRSQSRTTRYTPDGKAAIATSQRALMRLEIPSGTAQELYKTQGTGTIVDLSISPDGEWVAFQVLDNQNSKDSILVIPAGGGQSRQILELKTKNSRRIPAFDWMAGGTSLLISLRGEGSGDAWQMCELVRVPIDGGKPQPTGFKMANIRHLNVSPDGSRIAFQAGEYKGETWTLENFLPKTAARR
ncbi:MAG: PD40 domain-containing protein [Acidobacteriia bacterium]|nr:PD40 domain-containing protein [Terriglobia bacterium]